MYKLDLLQIIKILILVYIIVSPFINYKYFNIANSFIFKLVFIIVIAIVSFIDLQLAILTTLAFLILIINLNMPVPVGSSAVPGGSSAIQVPVKPSFLSQEHFAVGVPPQETISEFPDKCNNHSFDDEQLNTDILNIYIDPKIKPYENFIKQLSPPELIENASGNLV